MTKPENSQYICWVDLETTGNRPEDHIIEVGAVLTDRELTEIDSVRLVIGATASQLEGMEPLVVNMHTKNGLLAEVGKSNIALPKADQLMAAWIKQYTKGEHIPLAGSGVLHFDRPYIKKDLPEFNRYLSYWAYDVGVIRRTLRLWGIDTWWADAASDGKNHRALDDVRGHIEEMRRYKMEFEAGHRIITMLGSVVVSSEEHQG